METLRQRIRKILEEGPASADVIAKTLGVERRLVSSSLSNLRAEGFIDGFGTWGSMQYELVSAPRASLSDEARQRMSRSARERRFREAPRRRTAPGSGVIAPPPYARGYRWQGVRGS